MACTQKRPKQPRSGFEKMGDKQIEAIPSRRDENRNAEAPRTIPAGEYNNCDINQRLKQMQKAKLWNYDGGNR